VDELGNDSIVKSMPGDSKLNSSVSRMGIFTMKQNVLPSPAMPFAIGLPYGQISDKKGSQNWPFHKASYWKHVLMGWCRLGWHCSIFLKKLAVLRATGLKFQSFIK